MATQEGTQSRTESVKATSHRSHSLPNQPPQECITPHLSDSSDSNPIGVSLPYVDEQPLTAAAEGSVIEDGGDAKQLEVTASRSRKGSFLSSEQEADPSTSDSQPKTEGNDLPLKKSLEDQLRDVFVVSMWPPMGQDEGEYRDHYDKFLPLDKLDQIINKNSARCELQAWGVCEDSELNQKVREIWKLSSFPKSSDNKFRNERSEEPTTRRKLFAILVLMGQVPTILQMIEEEMYDRHLPFKFNGTTELQWEKDNAPVPISFDNWHKRDHDSFRDYQWLMLAPYLDLDEKIPTVPHYVLHPKIRLPFIKFEDQFTEDSFDYGGYAEVRKVNVHPAHHPQGDYNNLEKNLFAIKTLHSGKANKLEDERQALLRVMDEKNPHLIRLLLTINHGGKLSLMFPWATGNLLQFWKEQDPEVYFPSGKLDLIRWMAKQFSGLLGGLYLIHNSRIEENNPHGLAPDKKRIYGRHGDLKPENILWFEGDKRILKIADFGLVNFHSKESYMDRASKMGKSPTYRAPEFDGKEVGPRSDLWSLGCILLEFLVWYHGGWKAVEEFSMSRLSEEATTLDIREDKFFMSSSSGNLATQGNDSSGILLKKTVRREISRLRDDKDCGNFAADVLSLIEDRLLRVRPSDRAKCEEVYTEFTELNEKCCSNSDYCMKSSSARPSTANATPRVNDKPGSINDEGLRLQQSQSPDTGEITPRGRRRRSTSSWTVLWQRFHKKMAKIFSALGCLGDSSSSLD